MVKDYKNNFGELNENLLTLFVNDRIQIINVKDLIKIRFVKRQKYHINYIAFLLSIYSLLFLKNNNLSHILQITVSFFIIILLVISCFFRTYQYRFILIQKNYFTEILVNEKERKDAENLAYQINKMEVIQY